MELWRCHWSPPRDAKLSQDIYRARLTFLHLVDFRQSKKITSQNGFGFKHFFYVCEICCFSFNLKQGETRRRYSKSEMETVFLRQNDTINPLN